MNENNNETSIQTDKQMSNTIDNSVSTESMTATPEPMVSQETPVNTQPNGEMNNQEKPKKGNKNIILIVLIVLVVGALIAFGVITLINKNKVNDVNNNTNNGGNTVENENDTPNNNEENNNTNTGTIPENNNDTPNNNQQVSNSWKDYVINVNGKNLNIPCTYKDLASATGFNMKSLDEKSYLSKNHYATVNLYKNDKLALYTEVLNDTNDDIQYTDGKVTRVSQSAYQVDQGADAIVFPASLKVGMELTEQDLISKLGNPDDKDEYTDGNYVSVTYKYLANKDMTTTNYFSVKVVNGKVDELVLDNR